MRKLRVGIWLYSNLEDTAGGAYGYYTRLIEAIKNYNFKDADIIFLSNKQLNNEKTIYKKINWGPLVWPNLRRIIKGFLRRIPKCYKIANLIEYIEKQHAKKLSKELYQYADIIYYLIPQQIVYPNFPFIATIWDLGHKITYAFPEVAMNNTFENRNNFYSSIVQKALMIFSESETGKNDIIKYLNINPDRVKVVPIFPSALVEKEIVSEKPPLVLDNNFEFIHYPAQIWPHKNHYNLLLAFKTVISTYPDLKLILTGSDKGNKEYIISIIDELKIKNSIIDLGFVTIEELKWLYQNSKGLVMPTFFGPTNMPPLEAAELGCPVACSDIPGHREMLGDYAFYFNPKLFEDMSKVILEMLQHKGRKKYVSLFNISNTIEAIDSVFSELKAIRLTWGENDIIF